jgi:hypothetical protein
MTDNNMQPLSPWDYYQKRKAAAQKEGYTGRFWSRDYQPKGTKPVWISKSTENPNITYWKPDELARGRFDLPHAQYDSTKEQQSYWDRPQAVGRWYDFLSVQDADFIPPDWLNKDSITSLYKELKYFNDGSEDWQNWKPLPFGSVANYQAQMMPYPFGENPNQNLASRKQTLYEKRLPTIMGNLGEAIEQYNTNMTVLKQKDAASYSDFEKSLEPIRQYNLTMERIKEIDPEMYAEMGGAVDVNKMSEIDFNELATPEDNLPDYSKMEKWAQVMLMFTSAGEMKNRPEGTRKFAAGIQGAMAAVASGSIAAGAAAPIALAAGVPSAGLSLITIPVAFVVGAIVGYAQYQSAISGVNNPVIQKPMRLLGILDEWTEQIIGAGGLVARQLTSGLSMSERKQLAAQGYTKAEIEAMAEQAKIDDPAKKLSEIDFGSAWRAGQLSYESGSFNAGDWLTDFVSKAYHAIDPENNSGLTTGVGQVWQLHKGLDTPQNTDYWGPNTLQLVQDDILSLGKDATKEELDLVLAKWIDRYGYSGNLNNFAGQLLISPTNFVPAGVNAAMAKLSPSLAKFYKAKAISADDFVSKMKYNNLAMTADKLPGIINNWNDGGGGRLVTDAMPMGVQQLFEKIMTSEKVFGNLKIGDESFATFWKGTQSPFNVITMAVAQNNAGWHTSIADAVRLAKFPVQDMDGNVITKGTVEIFPKDQTYVLKGDDGIEYTLSKDGDTVIKATKGGTDVTLDKPLKAGVDAELKVKVADYIKDVTVPRDIEEYNKVLTDTTPSSKLPARLRDTNVVKTLSRLTNLTPASQVQQTVRYAMEAINNIVYFSKGNGKATVELIRALGSKTDVSSISNAAGQFQGGNIMAHAWRVFSEYTKPGGSFDDLAKVWDDQTQRRMELRGLAKHLGLDVTDMVKKMTGQEVFDAVKKVDPALTRSVADITDLMKPYKTKNPLPLTDAEFVSRLTVDMMENTTEFLVKHYDVKPLSGATRLSNTLKAALGVGVITLNVPVWITNFLTNEMCVSLFIGASGISPKSAISKLYNDVGVQPGGLWGKDFGLADDLTKSIGSVYTALNPPNAFMSKTLRAVQAFNKKLPVVGELYGKIENGSKARAGYGAFVDAMRMPLSDALPEVQAELSKYLSPSQEKALNRVINTVKNADQLEAALGQTITYRPLLDDAIEKALYDSMNGDPTMKPLIEDLLTKTGLNEFIRERLANVKSPEELIAVNAEIWKFIQEQANVRRGAEIGAKVEEIRNNPEGAINLLNVSGENGIFEFNKQIEVNRIWGEAMPRIRAAYAAGKNDLAALIYTSTRAQTNDIWNDTFSYIKTTTRAAIEKAGVGEYGDRMVIILDELSKNNSKFFSEMDDLHTKQFENKDASIDYDKIIEDRTTSWRDAQEASLQAQADLWVEMLTKSESATNGLQGDELRATAHKFMNEFLTKRKELRKLVDDHYESVKNKTWSDKADDDFWIKVYQPKVAEIRNMFVDGYYDKFFRIHRTKVTDAPEVTPRTSIQTAIDQLKANIIRIESLPEARKAHQWSLDLADRTVLERLVQDGVTLDPDQQKSWDKLKDKQLELPFEKVADPTESKGFKQWFGDSKAVDKQGKPITFFHGSPKNFKSFDISKANDDGFLGKGFYFKGYNGDVLQFARGDGYIHEVYLSIKNPIDLSMYDKRISSNKSLPMDVLYAAIKKFNEDPTIDGIILGGGDSIKEADEIMVRSPDQIRFKDAVFAEDIDITATLSDVMKVALDQREAAAIDLAKKLLALDVTDEGLKRQVDAALVALNDLVKTPEGEELPAITNYPLASQPQAMPTSRGWLEVANNQLLPVINRVFDNFSKTLGQQQEVSFKLGDQLVNSSLMKGQVERWKTDLQMKVSTAMDYAKLMTDSTLLNYTEKTGMDMLLQNVFPFHFWYTHSIGEWAKHIISKPSIYTTYAKWQQLKERNGLKLPTRMAGKLRIPAPWLPEWAGDALFVNPLAKFFPVEALMQPLSNMADLSNTVNDQVVSQIKAMVRADLISEQQATEAIQLGQGGIWDTALAQVQVQNPDTLDPMSAVSWSMQPAPWFTMPYYALTGQSEKNSLYPLTRQGQAWAAQGRNIGGVGGGILETIGELLALPEVKIREITKLSPYGEYGDYYIEFMLSNMAAEGADADAVVKAMIEKKGDLWDTAKQRADEYLSFRMPGSAIMQVIASGELEYLAPAILTTAFPAGLYPEGELKQRGLYEVYQDAWDKFIMGDTKAMQTFYNENPEYEARLALFKEPEERLHSHLINLIWDSYTALSDPDKKLVQDQFGQAFQTYFLDTKTRNYEKVDNDTLAYWGRQLKAQVPETEATQGALTRTLTPLETYKPDVATAAQGFMDLRKQQFPNYYWLQNLYYAIPEGDRQSFMKGFPELKNYFDWKEKYVEANPLVGVYLDDQKARYVGSDATEYAWALAEEPNTDLIQGFDAELALAVGMYAIGNPLSDGAKAELTRIWTGLGKPGNDFDLWLRAYLGL